jgi:membrane protein YdbS with pleckstrin-like domain
MAKAKTDRREMMWLSVISVLIPAILIVGALVYVAFCANGYSLFQKIVVVVIALIVAGVAEALIWMVWAAGKGLMNFQQCK